jgi:hypothetical protein
MIETGAQGSASNHRVCGTSSISSIAKRKSTDGVTTVCIQGKKNHKEGETRCTGFQRPRYGLHIPCNCSCHRKAKKYNNIELEMTLEGE